MKYFRKIKLWWIHEGKYLHRNIQKGIHNLYRWFPIIWKDRDWDDHYIWVLLEQKLINQANFIGKRGIHLHAERDAERMMTCVRLIKRIREEYYQMEYMDYHKCEFHWDDMPDEPDYKQLRIEELSENFNEYFRKYPSVYKKIIERFDDDEKKSKHKIALYMARENHNRAKKTLFKLLENHIESWWD